MLFRTRLCCCHYPLTTKRDSDRKQRKPALNKYFDRVFQNVVVESSLVRWQNTLLSKSRAQVSNAMIDLFTETVDEFTDKKA